MVDAGRILIRGLVIIAAAGLLAMGCSAGGTALKEDAGESLAKMQGIEVTQTDENTTVLLSVDRPVTFTSVKLSDPPMMVIDLAGVELGDETKRIEVDKDPVTYISPSSEPVSKRIARLEIGLTRTVVSDIKQEGSVIKVVFEKSTDDSDTVADTPLVAPASDMAEPVAADMGLEAEKSAAPEVAGNEAQGLPDATVVHDISFSESGKALSVRVEGDGRFVDHKAFMVGKDRLVLDIFGVGSLKEKDTISVGGKYVRQVRMARHGSPDEKVRVVLDLTGEVDYDVKTGGSALVVAVAPRGSNVVAEVSPAVKTEASVASKGASKEGSKVETAMSTGRKVTVSVPPVADTKDETPKIYVTQKDGHITLSSAPPEAATPGAKVVGSDQYVVTETKVYTGGKISFDIQDADLEKVIKLLADVAGLNLIVNPSDVQGKVTLKLANVPWDQALDILLKIYNLDKVIEGNVLRVAPKAKLDAEKQADLRAIKALKDAKEAAEDLYTKTFKINYADASELENKVKKILSKRGEATSNPRTNELIITDIKDKIEEAGQLIDILDKEVNQILIEARIVTVDVGYSQSLGVSWGLARNPDPVTGEQPGAYAASGSNSSVEFDDTAGSYVLTVPSELGADAAGLVTGLTWLRVMDNVNLDLTISALESINKAETLAAPKVMTLENQSAQITSGTTLYVQTTSAAGTKPEPLNANLSLTVTPRVTGDNFINMQVDATNSQPLQPPPGSTAAIDTKSVQTNVLVKNGDTIVLGGIYIKTKSKGDSQVPWLGRIPIIGWLFKERTTNDSTSELLIFITPKLVKQEKIRA